MDSSIYFDKANGDSMQTLNENMALSEQIDQAFMFEEIVGSSTALRRVLSSVLNPYEVLQVRFISLPQVISFQCTTSLSLIDFESLRHTKLTRRL